MKKKCFKCGKVKHLSEFYSHPNMSDGHLNKCKECTKKDVSENYANNREQYSEYDRKRNCRENRRNKKLDYQRIGRLRNPQKSKARNSVNNAIRNGRLNKLPCEICGNVNSEAHHDDYSRPLDVRWLCFKHHREIHGQVVVES